MKFVFVRDHLQAYPVTLCCKVLGVSRSGYYAWRARPLSARQQRRHGLAVQIRQVHASNRQGYGSPRICAALRAQGHRVCRNTVAKIMRQQRLQAKAKRRFVPRTPDSLHSRPVAENVLDRQFTASAPNQKWVADITYVPTAEGWLYLAGVMDLFSRKVVGFSMADHLREELVADALEMALAGRRPGADLLHHSDRGVQYASDAYQGRLSRRAIVVSMSRRGNCYDNAVMESFWATLKTELIHHQRYATREQARRSIFEYIAVFYNRHRLHSSLGYQSPEAFEASPN